MFLKFQETELVAEIWDCLEHVTDPELDEPVTDMGFVEKISVDQQDNRVEVEFRLPTYWCSPNFAFLMAFDIHNAVSRLPWVTGVGVTLNDHCFADRVNEGVNGGRDFASVFSEFCEGENLDAVRLKFLEKAYMRRQEVMLQALKAKGYPPAEIIGMTLDGFDTVNFCDPDGAREKPRYRSLLMSRGLAETPADPAFPTWNGERLTEGELGDYMARLRGVRINMEFNGALCRGLQSTRYKEVEIGKDGPGLIDFIQNRVPPRDVDRNPLATT